MKIKFEFEHATETARPILVADALIQYAFNYENDCCRTDDEEAWNWLRNVKDHIEVELSAHERDLRRKEAYRWQRI